jgi:poly(ADP-ribose) glycohydrolase
MLQVDFANKLVGGGVLNHGCVQEEIRFCINPELIIARFLTQQLLDEEVLIIKGTEQYNTYDGYSNSFKWVADYKDLTPTDEWGRRNTTIVAMDAIRFTSNNTAIQYDRKNINRELNKAYCGFYEEVPSNRTPIATGNWGCGAFNGDQILKAFIQLMAASECERDLVYFTFNDSSLKKELEKFYTFISTKSFTVKHLYKALTLYDRLVIKSSKSFQIDLFQFITHNLDVIFKT